MSCYSIQTEIQHRIRLLSSMMTSSNCDHQNQFYFENNIKIFFWLHHLVSVAQIHADEAWMQVNEMFIVISRWVCGEWQCR